VFSSSTPSQAITTSASDERNESHSATSESEAIERLRDTLSEIDSAERARLKLSDRGRGRGDRRQRHRREIDIGGLRVRETHSEILLSKGERVKD
jgi:hypothetical protein